MPSRVVNDLQPFRACDTIPDQLHAMQVLSALNFCWCQYVIELNDCLERPRFRP